MRTAVICLAYLKDSQGVSVLAEYFADTPTDLFIHIDAKSDQSAYIEFAKDKKHVHVVPTRLPIYWGGFNTVRACINSIQYAKSTADYSRYAFLTEDTIPLVPQKEFINRMSSDVEFIETRNTTNQKNWDRYNKFFFFDSLATTPRYCLTNEREISPDILLAFTRLTQARAQGKAAVRTLYHGGTWWALTAQAIEKVLRSYREDGHLRQSFEFSAIPEEQYFHTILGEIPNSLPMIFTEWNRDPAPYVYKTASEIKATDTLNRTFLRKVRYTDESIRDYVRDLG